MAELQQPNGGSQPAAMGTELSVYAPSNYELARQAAESLATSTLVPQQFRNAANALIAIDMANRLRCSPLMVMQQLYVVQGKPSWSAQFVIAAINACGRFTPLRFVLAGQGMERQCHAESNDKATGELLQGPAVSMQMAKAEGWLDKGGSKWKTMPELMLRYRAGTFFGRLYAPDVLMGLYTQDEALDIASVQDVTESFVSSSESDEFI